MWVVVLLPPPHLCLRRNEFRSLTPRKEHGCISVGALDLVRVVLVNSKRELEIHQLIEQPGIMVAPWLNDDATTTVVDRHPACGMV